MLAPLLIDSQDLQEAVFEAGIADEMLAGIDDAGIVGLGILPGPMRKVLGVEHPFIAPSDFEGETVGMQDGGIAEQTLLTLGASPRALPTDADLSTVDAYEQQLGSIAGNNYWRVAEFVSANVNLWPRPLVVFINAETFASLNADQRSALHDAAGAIVDGVIEDARGDDAGAVQELCESGMTLVEATDDDLVELRQAVQPVYDDIASEPENAAWLAEIEALKDEVGAPPDTAACTSPEATITDSATAAIEGTYQWTITDEIALERGTPEDQTEELLATYPMTITVTLEDGQWTMSFVDDTGVSDTYRGTFTVVRDHIAFDWGDGFVLEFTFAVGDDGTITLTPAPGTPEGDAFVWSVVPWTQVPD